MRDGNRLSSQLLGGRHGLQRGFEVAGAGLDIAVEGAAGDFDGGERGEALGEARDGGLDALQELLVGGVVEFHAIREGVDEAVIRAAAEVDAAGLPAGLRDVQRFAIAVCVGEDAPGVRDAVIEIYGEAAAMEIALSARIAQVLPSVKKSLGYATVCALPEAGA